MGMNIDDQQLIISLLKFVSGVPVQFQLVDLYGSKKPSQLFNTTTTVYHVFAQLKKKTKNINRGIVGGGGSWKGVDNSKPVYDKKKSLIGFKKTFCFEEKNHVWTMKEYRLSDQILKALRLRGHIRHEDEFVACRITWSNVKSFPASCVPISSETVKSFAQENQDLGQSNAANVIPSDQLNSTSNGNISQVSLVLEESDVAAAKEKECSVPVETRPNNDIATYHKELDAYAASVLETMVPYIPEPQHQEDEADSIPLFWEDFYIGYTNLWS